jgi:hypothetical protein
MLKRKSPSHTAKRGTAEVDFGVGLVPKFPVSRLSRNLAHNSCRINKRISSSFWH